MGIEMSEDPLMTVRDLIEDFWFDWALQEVTSDRVRFMILETRANQEFEKGLQEIKIK